MMTILQKDEQIHQGDIFRNVECIETAEEVEGEIFISKITYPYVIVMSQECDLNADYKARLKINRNEKPYKANHIMDNVLIVPLYNYEHFRFGLHLEKLDYKMSDQYNPSGSESAIDALIKNQVPRYHYFKFPSDISIVDSIADFKHYFTVNLPTLYKHLTEKERRVCSLAVPFRERVSQRFAEYLSRIGLPN